MKIKKTNLIWAGVIALGFVGIFFAGWWSKPVKIVVEHQQIDSLRNAHREDSIQYAFNLSKFIDQDSVYEKEIQEKDQLIASLRYNLSQDRKVIEVLPADKTIQMFSEQTGDSSLVGIVEGDTVCISTVPSIRIANVLFKERMSLIKENRLLSSKIETYLDLVDHKNENLALTYARINKLTDEYYRSQTIINNQQKFMERYAKKVRNRNIWMGIIGGLAVGGIATALIVN